MANQTSNQVDEVLFSFTYAQAQQASRCNGKLVQLMNQSIIPELGKAFDQVSYSGLQIELKNLEINLGRIAEEDISYRLGGRIKEALVQALKAELSKQIGVSPQYSKNSNLQSEDFAFLAIKSFFLNGYFPSWVDQAWDLYSVLEQLLTKFPTSFGLMIKEVSRKNSASRKRIAYLNSGFFDRIVAVLVPTDAAWIIDYRDSYLKIHKTESNLPGTSENLEKALNLFILNFIVQDSGPKFNRLSFTDRFLKQIAAHYNIDFKVFLKEITSIVAKLSSNNQLQQDFKEAIDWVGEKNLNEVYSEQTDSEPSLSEFIEWLNHSQENEQIQDWVKSLTSSGILFHELARKFPDFWRILNTQGLNNLLGLLADGDANQWQSLTQEYLTWSIKQNTGNDTTQKPELIKELFDFSWKEYQTKGTVLFDLEDWFSIHLLYFSHQSDLSAPQYDSLMEIGLDHGISNAPLIWIRAKDKSKSKRSQQPQIKLLNEAVKNGTDDGLSQAKEELSNASKAGYYQEMTVLAYLDSGSLNTISGKLNEEGLVELLAEMVKSQNPALLNWLKNKSISIPENNPKFKSRLWRLIKKLNRSQFLEYVSSLGDQKTLKLLKSDLESELTIQPDSKLGIQLKNSRDSGNPVLDQLNKGKHFDAQLSQFSTSQELALLEYLRSGFLRKTFKDLGERDLVDLLSVLVKDQNAVILNWLKKSNQDHTSNSNSRLFGLIGKLKRKDFLDFVSRFGGSQTLKLIELNKAIEKLIQPASERTLQLDRLIWSTFLDEIGPAETKNTSAKFPPSLKFAITYMAILSKNRTVSSENITKIEILQKYINSKKEFAILLAQNQNFVKSLDSNLAYFLNTKGLWSSKLSLLTIGSNDFRKMRLSLSSLRLNSPLRLALDLRNFLLPGLFRFDSGSEEKLIQVQRSLEKLDLEQKNNEKLTQEKLVQGQKNNEKLTQEKPDQDQKNKEELTQEKPNQGQKNNEELIQERIIQNEQNQEKLNQLKLIQEQRKQEKLNLQKQTQEKNKKGALVILRSDLNTILNASFYNHTDKFRKTELKAAIRRMFVFFQVDSDPILRFFNRSRSHLFFVLPFIKVALSQKEWSLFSVWLQQNFRQEFDRSESFWKSETLSFWSSLNLSGGKSKISFEEINKIDPILKLSLNKIIQPRIFKEELARIFTSGADLRNDLIILMNLPESVFYRKNLIHSWRRIILLSVVQFKAEKDLAVGIPDRQFWKIFLAFLKERSAVFNLTSMNWNYLVKEADLNPKTTSALIQFIDRHFSIDKAGLRNPHFDENIPNAIVFLKDEGYLPWWSPVKSKLGLVQELLHRIEQSDPENANSMVSILISGNIKRLFSGLKDAELRKIIASLSESKYQKQFANLTSLIATQLDVLIAQNQEPIPVNDPKDFEIKWSPGKYKKLPSAELEKRIRRSINASQEVKLIRVWFSIDPRIQKQIEDLMSWSPLMYFGSLNSGKWKLWLLSFGFDFYIKRGNIYSRGFLSQFIAHLTKSQSGVNWRGVFHQLVRHKEFLIDRNKFYKVEILSQFPIEEKVSFEEPKTGDQVRVTNAGLILCWPFLSVLFSRLKLSAGNKIPEENQSKAVYLLQYLVYGRSDFPEYELVLNKILVGMKSSQHLEEVELTKEEKEMTESLLFGMRSNWEKMKNATIDAIRETFLQREGLIEFGQESFILRVPKTGVDILLDSVSWNIAVIRLPWMEKSLEVKWR